MSRGAERGPLRIGCQLRERNSLAPLIRDLESQSTDPSTILASADPATFTGAFPTRAKRSTGTGSPPLTGEHARGRLRVH